MSNNINVIYDGPAKRFFVAIQAVKEGKELNDSDVWTERLYDILMLRKRYQDKKQADEFGKRWPLFRLLLNTFEATGVGNDRELLEAALIATDSAKEIAKTLNRSGFTPAFINLYSKFFYDLSDIRGNDVKFAQHILLPLINAGTDRLAVGAIWKLLACSGGLQALVEKGFKSAAIRPEDISFLLQLTCMRNCSMLLQYAAEGRSMIADQPGVQMFLATLTDMDGIRGPGRRSDGFAIERGTNRSIYNSMLNEGVKLISAPDEIADELLSADGAFHPELEGAREYAKHSLIEEINNE